MHGAEEVASDGLLQGLVASEAVRLYWHVCKSDGFEAEGGELEAESKGVGLQYGRHARLYCAGGVPADGLRTSVRLVVAGRDHVRDADGLSAVLLGQSSGYLPEGDELAGDPDLPAGDADLRGGEGSNCAVLLRSGSTVSGDGGKVEEIPVIKGSIYLQDGIAAGYR